jgi:hypothetical protein
VHTQPWLIHRTHPPTFEAHTYLELTSAFVGGLHGGVAQRALRYWTVWPVSRRSLVRSISSIASAAS